MSKRIFNHILFWLGYISLYVTIRMLFVSSSDEPYTAFEKLLRYTFTELAFLPWRALPFYYLFYYLIPRYFNKAEYIKMTLLFLVVLIICLLGYRSTIEPVQFLMYGDRPQFNVFSFSRIVYSLTELLPAIGLASSAKLLRGSIISRRKEMSLLAEKTEAELKFLKAQTNPHFLFNTLNNLYGLARRQDENTATSILKLSNIMRYVLYECNQESNLLIDEINIIEDYIELEKLRYDDRLNISVNKSVDNWNYKIAPLILLPFVENAFKHGASENRAQTKIDILINVENDTLRFEIINTREDDEKEIKDGIGLKNVKRQLDLIYGSNYSLEILPDPNLFSVSLFIYSNSDD